MAVDSLLLHALLQREKTGGHCMARGGGEGLRGIGGRFTRIIAVIENATPSERNCTNTLTMPFACAAVRIDI